MRLAVTIAALSASAMLGYLTDASAFVAGAVFIAAVAALYLAHHHVGLARGTVRPTGLLVFGIVAVALTPFWPLGVVTWTTFGGFAAIVLGLLGLLRAALAALFRRAQTLR